MRFSERKRLLREVFVVHSSNGHWFQNHEGFFSVRFSDREP